MIELLVVIIFLAWYILSLVISETLGKKRLMGVEWSFFYCMVFSPLIGFIITYAAKKEDRK